MSARPHHQRGFTLIEVMIVCVIIGILAAIALPSYWQYVQRSKIIQATTGLSDMRQRMEQKFLDTRTYDDTATPKCSDLATQLGAKLNAFVLSCTNVAATTYTLNATGITGSGMDGALYTDDQAGTQATPSGPTGYPSSTSCWITRKDGTCG